MTNVTQAWDTFFDFLAENPNFDRENNPDDLPKGYGLDPLQNEAAYLRKYIYDDNAESTFQGILFKNFSQNYKHKAQEYLANRALNGARRQGKSPRHQQ